MSSAVCRAHFAVYIAIKEDNYVIETYNFVTIIDYICTKYKNHSTRMARKT